MIELIDIETGDIVKFSGTRGSGIRKILKVYGQVSYFSQVMEQKMSGFSEQPYTSTNGMDKLTHVYRNGYWNKVSH